MSENSKNFTMLGTDIYFSNIVEDITYYSSNQQYTYAFLTDLQGRVLVHPSILRPSVVSHQLSFVDIKYIETVPDIELLRTKMLSEVKGNFITSNNLSQTVSIFIMQYYNIFFILPVY